MRRTVLLVVLGALAVGGTAGAVADRHPRDPREAFTAADRAWAQRIVLKRSDLPGAWTSTAPSSDDDARCATFDPDLSDLTLTGEADSRDFERGGLLVSSSAEIFRTAQQTATSFRRTAKRQWIRCFDQAFRDVIRKEAKPRLVFGRVVAAPRVGERRFAMRLIWTLTAEGGSVRVHTDLIGWDRGRTSAALYVFSIGTAPDRAREARVAQRIDSRMREP